MRPEELAGLIGEEAALHLMSRRTGQRMYVPMSVTDDLLAACGGDRKAAERFSSEYGRNFVVIPSGRRWRVMQMRKREMSVREISLALGMTERAVRLAFKDAKAAA